MGGPMQWTPGGLVPAGSILPSTHIRFTDSDADDDDDDDTGPFEPAAIRDLEAPRAPGKRRKAKPPAARPLRPQDVLKLTRARLREVDREIARLKKLEIERDQLRRLIDAADGKPRAVVRDITKRSSVG